MDRIDHRDGYHGAGVPQARGIGCDAAVHRMKRVVKRGEEHGKGCDDYYEFAIAWMQNQR